MISPFYGTEPDLSAKAFIDLLVRSTLAERRPVDVLARMVRHESSGVSQ